MIPFYHRLKIASEKKLWSTKPARASAEVDGELDGAQSNAPGYNRGYGWRYGHRSGIKKFFRRVLAPLVPLYRRIEIIRRKIRAD
jgi:hypothetical protein